MNQTVLVIHNVRSALNVGGMLRTAEGLGVSHVYMTGYTPYPEAEDDARLPHQARRVATRIHKTALGAEEFVKWSYEPDINRCLDSLATSGYSLVALEQTPDAISLDEFTASRPVALMVGNEVAGLEASVLKRVDQKVHIPMEGRKESFNVAIAAGIALYHLRGMPDSRQK